MSTRTRLPTLLAAVSACLAALPANAQNGTNYHILTNGPDDILVGVGAGGNQTADDGIGTWIAGEDLRGARITQLGEFGYRMRAFSEGVCLAGPPPSGGYELKIPLLAFVEFDGLNANAPPIFTNPVCSSPSFPLGASGFIPYGTGPASSVSFLLGAVPPGSGSPVTQLLLPDNGLLGSAGGTADVVALANLSIPLPSGGCYDVQFTWSPSAIALHDDIDGLWHWASNSPAGNQYWQMSTNEMNIWQSYSVVLDNGGTDVMAFTPNVDYAMQILSVDPTTTATLAPRAPGGTGTFYSQTAGVGDEFGSRINPNGGFDAGRGSSAISMRGLAGVPNPVTGHSNQFPGNAPGTLATLGFLTYDTTSALQSSVRLTWLAVDVLGMTGGDPATDPGVVLFGGAVRVPTVSAGLVQPVTLLGFDLFGHVTQPGFPDPHGGVFVASVGGASNQIPIAPMPAPCLGLALNITYGSSGRLGSLGAPGPLSWDPSVARTSGTRQLFLFD